uniref:Uncharacterized protein n=1 Tax=Anopheles melas TaxID=34690 RepID=A0A182UEG1_9DIPT
MLLFMSLRNSIDCVRADGSVAALLALLLVRFTPLPAQHATLHVCKRETRCKRTQNNVFVVIRRLPGSSLMRRRFELEPDSDFCERPSNPLMLYDCDATFSTCCGDFIDSWSACIC